MSKPGILLTQLRDGWELAGATVNAPASFIAGNDAANIARETVAFANEQSLDEGQLVIAIASQSVLFATIPATEAASIGDDQSLRFALEAVLPVDAEKIVADSIGRRSVTKKLGLSVVALEFNLLQPLVDALEQSQCKVQFIVPSSMLVFEQAVADRWLPVPSVSVWLFRQDENTLCAEILALDAEQSILAWRVSECDVDAIARDLMLLNSGDTPLLLLGSERDVASVTGVSRLGAEFIDIDCAELSRTRAATLLSGRRKPWVDLRRDQLAKHDRWRRHRGAISRFVFAASLLLATVCGTLLWRARQHHAMADTYNQRQQELFQTAFPGQRVPAAILARLRSETAKASGVRKTDRSTSVPQSALMVLGRAIVSLSDEFPFEVEEIRIDQGSFAMELTLMSQQDAGKVAAALAANGFSVEPPATTLVDGDRIQASLFATIDSSTIESSTGAIR